MQISRVIIRGFRYVFYSLIILVGTASVIHAEDLLSAVSEGKVTIDVRARYENVDQENTLLDADALTVRTRVGYGTGEFKNFKAYIDAENVLDIIDDYHSNRNGKTQYSVVADPDETEINQLYLTYSGLQNTEIKLGRQRIKLDNDRFIGNVGWRQLEQTYDGILIKNSSIPDTTVNYIYINGAKDILSLNPDLEACILNVSYTGWNAGTLSGYGYLMDLEDAPEASHQTLGLRFNGQRQFSNIKILYTAEYAKQDDYKDGSNGIDSDYLLLEAGAVIRPATLKLGYEKLGADSFSGFETPLATKHAFNGWADQFLGTPSNGLEDLYLSISGDIYGVTITGVYHDFSSDSGGVDFGTEFDFSAVKKFSKNYSAGLKYARYDADSYSVDTEKLWLWVQYNY